MKPHKLYLHGFRSFAKPTTFQFPAGPGLFFLRGRNEAFPELGANGVGKTTVFDGICWVLTGKTTRGLGAGDVETWLDHKSKPKVEGCLIFEHQGMTHEVRRTRGPNSLMLDGTEVEQRVVEELLGYGHQVLLSTLLMGQFGTFFFDMKPAPRLELFSQVMGLDVWTRASKEATKKVKLLLEEIQQHTYDQSRLDGRISAVTSNLEELEYKAASWEEDRVTRLQELQETREDTKEDQERSLEKIRRLVDQQITLSKESDKKKKEIKSALEEEAKAQRIGINLERDFLEVKQALAKSVRLEGEAGDLEGDCPTCGRAVTKLCRNTLRKLYREEVRLFSIEAGNAEKLAKVQKRKVETIRAVLNALDSDLDSMEVEEENLVSALHGARAMERSTRDRGTSLDARIKEKQEETSPYESMIKDGEKQLDELEDKLEGVTEDLMACLILKSYTNFWIKGFKKLRLWIVNRALDMLELEANASMVALGLRGWKVSFEVDRETQTGTIAHGFNVLIQSPTSKKPVKWENWSGGETQRLRVAGAVGLSSLVRGQLGIDDFFEVWDEPTEYLSGEGLTDMINFFGDRADEGRQIWMIDHRALDAGLFTETFDVVYTEKGSELR